MSIRMKDLVGTLSKEHEKIVAAEFDKRYPNTGILDFTIHAKSQFILRGYNDNDMKQMLKVIDLKGTVGREYVIKSTSLSRQHLNASRQKQMTRRLWLNQSKWRYYG